jgi:hypothetical protein
MCEPRRVQITITRQVREAWEREIERVAEATQTVTGEARIVQPLDASVGASALLAFHAALARGIAGWQADGDGYRHDLDGGHVFYDPATRSLEIVATLSETVTRTAAVRDRLSGVVDGEVSAEGRGNYYHDGWGGRTRERAEAEAREMAEQQVGNALRARIDEEAAAAARERENALAANADAAARQAVEAAAAQRRAALASCAAEELRDVGARARLTVNRALAGAYRDALLALARRRGVAPDAIRQSDSGDRLEIEFVLPD